MPTACRTQSARVLTDLSQLEQVRRLTAMEVFRSFERVWRMLTRDELCPMVMLMPDDTERATASPGRKTNTRQAEAGGVGAVRARTSDLGADRGDGR